jgi:hypothetical protein
MLHEWCWKEHVGQAAGCFQNLEAQHYVFNEKIKSRGLEKASKYITTAKYRHSRDRRA